MSEKLLCTSVIRSSEQGSSHGGIYVIDVEKSIWSQVVDWNDIDINWNGCGGERGLRGICFYRDLIFVAASNEVIVFDRKFKIVDRIIHKYLLQCHELACGNGYLFMSSTGYDCVLVYDIEKNSFTNIINIDQDSISVLSSNFDISDRNDTIHINSVFFSSGVIYVSGSGIYKIFEIDSDLCLTRIHEKDVGTHNTYPFGDGFLYNWTYRDSVRCVDIVGKQKWSCLSYKFDESCFENVIQLDFARPYFCRGLCFSSLNIFSGISPASIMVINPTDGTLTKLINITMDVRCAIHGLEVAPYEMLLDV